MVFPESRVPNELWGEVLQNVDEYDKSTFKSFSLTCRAFCGISRPRLFSDIRFTPYAIGRTCPALLPSPSEVDRRIERLDFLCSGEIAPLVRSCHISAYEPPYGSNESSFSTDTPYILLDALFERLVRFTGLRRLSAFRIPFTQARVDILFRLPHLSYLDVNSCTVTPGGHIQPSAQASIIQKTCVT
ncbi:hypothetical protein B0H13DRAFT_2318410 [Mycena leptocephala]|nr:hypothetical protein B0H13DRAFT_2318410 [Mycena leptocephala]